MCVWLCVCRVVLCVLDGCVCVGWFCVSLVVCVLGGCETIGTVGHSTPLHPWVMLYEISVPGLDGGECPRARLSSYASAGRPLQATHGNHHSKSERAGLSMTVLTVLLVACSVLLVNVV